MSTPKPDWATSIARTPDVVVLQFAKVSSLPTKLQDALRAVPALKTIIHELYMNTDYAYVIGVGKERETILARLARRPNDDFGETLLVLLPASEFEERAPLDLVTEAIQTSAWS